MFGRPETAGSGQRTTRPAAPTGSSSACAFDVSGRSGHAAGGSDLLGLLGRLGGLALGEVFGVLGRAHGARRGQRRLALDIEQVADALERPDPARLARLRAELPADP